MSCQAGVVVADVQTSEGRERDEIEALTVNSHGSLWLMKSPDTRCVDVGQPAIQPDHWNKLVTYQ
jgi:hypothetical protein